MLVRHAAELRDALLIGAWGSGGAPDPEGGQIPAIAMARRGEVVYTAEPDAVGAWTWCDGALTRLGQPWPSPGTLPCHLAVTADGAHVIVAHYDGGLVTVHPVAADGSLTDPGEVRQLIGQGPDPERQSEAHPHMVWCGPDGDVIVVDLGADLLRRFVLDAGRLVPGSDISLPPGTGPRHLVVADGVAYVAGELADTLVAVRLSTGEVLHVEPCGSGEADPAAPSYPSAIKLSVDGRHCHVLRRGPNSIATFELGLHPRLIGEVPCGGDWPWDLVVAGDQIYVANQRPGTVSVLHVDPATGLPVPTGEVVTAPDAVSLLLLTETERSIPA